MQFTKKIISILLILLLPCIYSIIHHYNTINTSSVCPPSSFSSENKIIKEKVKTIIIRKRTKKQKQNINYTWEYFGYRIYPFSFMLNIALLITSVNSGILPSSIVIIALIMVIFTLMWYLMLIKTTIFDQLGVFRHFPKLFGMILTILASAGLIFVFLSGIAITNAIISISLIGGLMYTLSSLIISYLVVTQNSKYKSEDLLNISIILYMLMFVFGMGALFITKILAIYWIIVPIFFVFVAFVYHNCMWKNEKYNKSYFKYIPRILFTMFTLLAMVILLIIGNDSHLAIILSSANTLITPVAKISSPIYHITPRHLSLARNLFPSIIRQSGSLPNLRIHQIVSRVIQSEPIPQAINEDLQLNYFYSLESAD